MCKLKRRSLRLSWCETHAYIPVTSIHKLSPNIVHFRELLAPKRFEAEECQPTDRDDKNDNNNHNYIYNYLDNIYNYLDNIYINIYNS